MAAFASAPEVGRRVLLSFVFGAWRTDLAGRGAGVDLCAEKATGPHLLLDTTLISLSLSLSHCLAATSPLPSLPSLPSSRDLTPKAASLPLPVIARHPQIIEKLIEKASNISEHSQEKLNGRLRQKQRRGE